MKTSFLCTTHPSLFLASLANNDTYIKDSTLYAIHIIILLTHDLKLIFF